MPSSFQNPRNPLAAMWASAAETYLRRQHPDLSIQQIRQLPFMQGVYEHLSQLKRKRRLSAPPAQAVQKESDQAAKVDQMAYLSQTFFDLALTTAAFCTVEEESSAPFEDLYLLYLTKLEQYNKDKNIIDFSTSDLYGFALCVIVWVALVGLTDIDKITRKLLDYLINKLPLTQDQKAMVRNFLSDFWEKQPLGTYSSQYRNADNHTGYKVIPWKIPTNAQVVLLGDWGTSLDDAHEFLKALWRKAYQNNPGGTIVFIHLGDIYYCGLPYECEHYFRGVFEKVGKDLQTEINNANFNPNPPIFTIPGNHEYYSYGYGYFQLLDGLNQNVPNISHSDLYQQCSFFCLQTADNNWQFLGMDTGQADGNALLSALQGLGDIIKGLLTGQTGFDLVNSIEKLIIVAYEDRVGPFQPELQASELEWLQDRLDEFNGKTIMLSHHQLFSRHAEINHHSPQYLNTWLDKHFRKYFTKKIAAWYWGHEHSFVTYMDGLMGLNKGRLLGSSSYEATEEDDAPYVLNYPVPYSAKMNDKIIHNQGGFYYHTGAIMLYNGKDMDVKYYQFPAWSQLDHAPENLNLEEIDVLAEQITTTFKSLKPSWIGDVMIAEDEVTTDHSPALTNWEDKLFLLFVDGNDNRSLKICTANAAAFQEESRAADLDWSNAKDVRVNNNVISTKNSPATAAINGNLYVFYRDSDTLQGITTPTAGNLSNWTSIGWLPAKVDDAAPAICVFRSRIYIVYRKPDDDKKLSWGYYDIRTGRWQDSGHLKDYKGNTLTCSNTPALAADPYRMYKVYQLKGATDICWAFGEPSEMKDDGTVDEISWTNQGKVYSIGKQVDGEKDTTNPDTQIGLTLEYAKGVFLLVYVSTNAENNLTQCALNDTDKDSTGQWVGSNTVKVINTKSQSTARSAQAPSLAITSGGGFLVYRGKDHDEIYWAYY